MKEKYIFPLFIVSVVFIFSFFSWYLFNYFKQKDGANSGRFVQTVDQTSSPIPPSSEGAKEYIDWAMEYLNQKKYDEAISVLEEALNKYPEDQNLKLNIEYIENIKLRDVQ